MEATMIKLQQGTAEWLEWRKNGITATEASCIMGVSKWGTALTVWDNKLNPKEQTEKSKYQEWGTRIEALLREKFAENHPEFTVREGECYEREWRKCSLDGELEHRQPDLFGPEILECKTGSSMAGWDNEGVPDGYYAQAQWQMNVTGRDVVHFAVLISGVDYFERVIKRDQKYIDTMNKRCQIVWQCVLNGTTPPNDENHPDLDQSVLNGIAAERKVGDDAVYELSDEEYAMYCTLKEKMDETEKLFKAQKATFTRLLTEHTQLAYHGKTFGRMIVMKPRDAVDTKKLKEQYPEVYADVVKLGCVTSYPKFG